MGALDHSNFLGWSKTYASYGAAEFAEITGISTVTQRAWRMRGHLPPLDEGRGHARFSPEEVIAAAIRYTLSKLGVRPKESRIVDAKVISGALYHAILGQDGSCEAIGPPGEVDNVLEEYGDLLATELAERPDPTRYLIWDDEDGVRLVDDPQHVFDRRTASIIAIDLTVIGARMMERGRKPIVTIEAPKVPGERRVRRLS